MGKLLECRHTIKLSCSKKVLMAVKAVCKKGRAAKRRSQYKDIKPAAVSHKYPS